MRFRNDFLTGVVSSISEMMGQKAKSNQGYSSAVDTLGNRGQMNSGPDIVPAEIAPIDVSASPRRIMARSVSLDQEWLDEMESLHRVDGAQDFHSAISQLSAFRASADGRHFYSALPDPSQRAQFISVWEEMAREHAEGGGNSWKDIIKRVHDRFQERMDSMPKPEVMSADTQSAYMDRMFAPMPKRPEYDQSKLLGDTMFALGLGRTGMDKWGILSSVIASRNAKTEQEYQASVQNAQLSRDRAAAEFGIEQKAISDRNKLALDAWSNVDSAMTSDSRLLWSLYSQNPSESLASKLREIDPNAPTPEMVKEDVISAGKGNKLDPVSAFDRLTRQAMADGQMTDEEAASINTATAFLEKRSGMPEGTLPRVESQKAAAQKRFDEKMAWAKEQFKNISATDAARIAQSALRIQMAQQALLNASQSLSMARDENERQALQADWQMKFDTFKLLKGEEAGGIKKAKIDLAQAEAALAALEKDAAVKKLSVVKIRAQEAIPSAKAKVAEMKAAVDFLEHEANLSGGLIAPVIPNVIKPGSGSGTTSSGQERRYKVSFGQ